MIKPTSAFGKSPLGTAIKNVSKLGKTPVNIPVISKAYDGAMASLGNMVPPSLVKLANTPVGPMLRAGATAVANKLGPIGRAIVVAGEQGLAELRTFFCTKNAGQGKVPVPEGHTRVYRAVGEAEFQDIAEAGRFRQGPNGAEGKYFADSLDGAKAHGNKLYGEGKYRLIEADVPNNAPSSFQFPNLDGHGPARFLHIDDLTNIVPRPVR